MSEVTNDPHVRTRVLLVEENQDLRRLATDLLQRHDEVLLVGVSRGGSEAVTLVQELDPEVILLDLDGRQSCGSDEIPFLREALPGVGIIGLSLSRGNDYRQAVLGAGLDDLVCKPDLTRDLLPAVERVAAVQRFRSTRPAPRRRQSRPVPQLAASHPLEA